jgi:hypothetical protein
MFIIPIILALILNISYVAFTSFLCLITSIVNHYYENNNTLALNIDIVVVRLVALFHIIYALYKFRFSNIFILITYLFSLLTIKIYLDIHTYELYEYNYFIHYCSITGIVFYILGHYYSNLLKDGKTNFDNFGI